MDLVSSTLDKYLKHRFNTIGTEEPATTINGHHNNSTVSSDEISSIQMSPPLHDTFADSAIQNSISDIHTNHRIHADPMVAITEESPPILNSSQECPMDVQNQSSTNNDNPPILCNGTSDKVGHLLPRIYKISVDGSRPSCVAFKADLNYIAIGFENSMIFLWTIKENSGAFEVQDSSKLIAHSGPIFDIKFFDNNDLMLSCSEDTTIRLWCLKTKCSIFVYRGHSYPIWSLDIGSSGRMFASTSMDTTARLWRIDRMTPVRVFCGHEDDVDCIKFHPNEKYVATGSSDATVRLWSVSDGKMVRLMVGHSSPITSLSFLPNGKYLASASSDGSVKIWQLASNSVTQAFSTPPTLSISLSPNQQFISSCNLDNVYRLWQIKQDKIEEKKCLDSKSHLSNLVITQFHSDDKLFIVSCKTESSKIQLK